MPQHSPAPILKPLFNGKREHAPSLVHTPPISTMPKVSTFSPAPIARRKISTREEYIISYKEPRTIWSKPTLLLPPQRKHLSKLRHKRPMLTPEQFHNDISFTKVLAERTNASHRDTDPNPRWSPTVLRRRRQSPAPISFQLSSRKTSLQINDQLNALRPFLSVQDNASSKPSCKEVICSQQPRFQSDSAALREWIACIIFGFTLRGNQHDQPQPRVRLEAVTAVAANIKCLCEVYPLRDEVVFLALWYASHIMPEGVLDQFDLCQPNGIVLVTRLFVLSYTLAIKWLSDEPYALQNWIPHYQKGFSISSAKALDKAALELLDYNLYISPFQWTAWLHKLDEPPLANMLVHGRVHLVAQARIRNLLFESETSSLSSQLRSISTSATSVWKVHKILLENLAVSIAFPEPAPWNPAEDPIIHATGRRRPFTQAPSWSCGNYCCSPQSYVSPPTVYNSKGLSFLSQDDLCLVHSGVVQ